MTVQRDSGGSAVQAARPYLSQTVAIGAASAPSAAFATNPDQRTYVGTGVAMPTNQTQHVRLVATSDCWISFGAAPTAVASGTSSIFLPAGVPEYFWVYPGEKVAVIQNAAAGSLNIAEMVA
jgi:hypothetical protein